MGGSHCATSPGWLPGGLPRPLRTGFFLGRREAQQDRLTPRSPFPVPLVSFPLLFSQFQSFTCNRLPETTAFPVLCLMPPWEAGEQGELGEWRPRGSSPFALHHAALCRLALPNFCLKLNLKEKKTEAKKAGSLFLLGSPPARGEGGGWGGEERTSRAPCRGPGGRQGADLGPKPAAHSFVSGETEPRTLPRGALPVAPGRSARHLPVGQSRELRAERRVFLSCPCLQPPLGLACLGGARASAGRHGVEPRESLASQPSAPSTAGPAHTAGCVAFPFLATPVPNTWRASHLDTAVV